MIKVILIESYFVFSYEKIKSFCFNFSFLNLLLF